jgi:hypothetical protein
VRHALVRRETSVYVIFYYEPQGIDVWLHPSIDAGVICVAGGVRSSEAEQLKLSEHTDATWSSFVAEYGKKMLLLALHGSWPLGTLDLWFGAEPDEKVVDALRPRNGATMATAVFRDIEKMRQAIAVSGDQPGDTTADNLRSKALFFGPFEVEAGALEQLADSA